MFEDLFQLSGLSLERLKSFIEIVEARGITAAAKGDPNRQSQLSRQLKELERYFGVQLMERGRNGVKLTAPGKQLNQVLRHYFGALRQFRNQCAQLEVDVNIGAGESLIQWLLLPRLKSVIGKNSKITFQFHNLRTDEILKGVEEGSLDFGLVTRLEDNLALRCARVGRLDYSLFIPEGSTNKRGTPQQILKAAPLALLLGSEKVRESLEAWAADEGLSLNVKVRFTSYPQLASAVLNLNVAGVMPALAAAQFPQGRVRVMNPPFLRKLSRDVSLVWHRNAEEIKPVIHELSGVLVAALAKSAKSNERLNELSRSR